MTPAELRLAMEALATPDGERYTWAWRRARIRDRILSGDDPREFLTWSEIHESMWRGADDEMEDKFTAMITAKDRGIWKAAMDDAGVGDAERYAQSRTINPNMIHQVYHLWRYHEATGVRLSRLHSVVEFGGGYGALALAAHNLGFRGKWYMVDFPEFLLLQRYFLEAAGVKGVTYCATEMLGSEWREVNRDRRLIVPTQRELPRRPDLLIAICSLSETNAETRQQFLDRVTPRRYLLRFAHHWTVESDEPGVMTVFDNVEYFLAKLPEDVILEPARDLKDHWYMFL